ncbi:hypothetical protein BJF79_42310 [Actinomadura sp. CNU-125]|uniref:hypothetical protein n=1 Tax=Actinomadura sp. CNU-125 TaxID=1904961 RepID=UPI000960E405|nr:hypothetical protein [Actinomadura sp. CNU-125]OLT27797.1 hypothetical protein BJF79_42310 [Actinomadura sp. CNU-125]
MRGRAAAGPPAPGHGRRGDERGERDAREDGEGERVTAVRAGSAERTTRSPIELDMFVLAVETAAARR